MNRGRPVHSIIRQNMIEVLLHLGQAYGYEIYKAYIDLFEPITLRSIYYHLKKGVLLGEFKKEKVKVEQGNYSWGGTAEKIYYSLGDKAHPKTDPKVKEYFDKKK